MAQFFKNALLRSVLLAGLPFSMMSAPVFAQTSIGDQAKASQSPAKVIVLDASGSMWGKIDGKAKIEIARDVVSDLLGQLDPSSSLGLVAYGHRVKGDCNDIETLVSPAPGSLDAVRGAVQTISPKGKTPLSAAVKEAARQLRHTEEAATVILVSDGKETCNLDPCAVASQLEADGVNFTAHVVGFDVAAPEDIAQLQCMADQTGGRYLSASNAQELAGALEEVSQIEEIAPSDDDFAPPEPSEPPKPAKAFFEDHFDTPDLAAHWTMQQDAPILRKLTDSNLILAAVSEHHWFEEDKALNRMLLDQDLPSGDFDLSIDFTLKAQTGRDEPLIGLYSDKNNQITASLFFEQTGCGIRPLLMLTNLSGPKDAAPQRVEFRKDVFKAIEMEGFCGPGATHPAQIVEAISQGGQTSLTLQKRGRDYSARLDTLIPAYNDNPEKHVSISTEPVTLLRAPAALQVMSAQRPPSVGESILFIDRVHIRDQF
ncbi:MAG: VWA domain-containing protein [Cohaesibacter sp.]|jgi:hypothetical protein|nr:VWA domain-containing protein [Cohaesibacter sp.]